MRGGVRLAGVVAGVVSGHTTASLLIARLHASSRQSALAKALHKYGRLVRTIYICRYVADEELRRRVRRQLNKGESLHALRRDLFFAHQGHVRRRHLDDQIDQALCLTLVTNACVLWTTTYLDDVLDTLRGEGADVRDEIAAHLTPAQHDHINFYGTYSFDLEAELSTNFIEATRRSRSFQCSAMRWVCIGWLSSGPACGYRARQRTPGSRR